jgi:hypothetical protein
MALLTLEKVYRTRVSIKKEEYRGNFPTLGVSGGTINLYVSNSDTMPTSSSTMNLDSSSPLPADIHTISGRARWILVESASGTPVVEDEGLIVDPEENSI